MTYPMASLAIIAPILFIALLVAFPLIGFFGGWKRAAYWGGGNLLFYLIGVISWKLAGSTISTTLAPVIKNLIQNLLGSALPSSLDLTQITLALIPPIYFLIIVLVGNILLVINYYAWFKRVSGIKRDIKIKKATKFNKWAAKLEGNKQAQTAVEIQTAKGAVIKTKTTKQKVVGGAVGAVALTALMMPTLITTTNAVMYATSTSTTRQATANGWVDNFYNGLDKLDKSMTWFSFYNGETGDTLNSLLSVVQLSTSKTEEEIKVVDPYTQEETVAIPKDTSVSEIVTTYIPNNLSVVVNTLKEFNTDKIIDTYNEEEAKETGKGKETADKTLAEAAQPVNTLAQIWNKVVETNQAALQAIFNSDKVTDLINQYLSDATSEGSTFKIPTWTPSTNEITQIFGEDRTSGLYNQILTQYQSGKKTGTSNIHFVIPYKGNDLEFDFKMTYIQPLKVSASSIANIKEIASRFIILDDLSDSDKQVVSQAIDDIVGLILQPIE